MKIITWVDLEGQYRITTPAFDHLQRARGFSEDDAINWVWTVLVQVGGYGIPFGHPMFVIDGDEFASRNVANGGETFWRAGKPGPDGKRRTKDGAWGMGPDGFPIVDMPKARIVQTDLIRVVRDEQLEMLDKLQMQAMGKQDNAERIRLEQEKQVLRDLPSTFDLSAYTTPEALKAAWPAELPARPA